MSLGGELERFGVGSGLLGFGVYWGYNNGKYNGNYYRILGCYWGNIGIMENKMETMLGFKSSVFQDSLILGLKG